MNEKHTVEGTRPKAELAAETNAQLEWIGEVLDDGFVSDFAQSFPLVRAVLDLKQRAERAEAACQQVMQALGPDGVPSGVDYGDPANLAGLSWEVNAALDAVRAVGIEYRRRKK